VSNFLAQLFQSEKKLWKSSGVGVLNIYFQPLTDPPAIAIGLERWSGSVVFLSTSPDSYRDPLRVLSPTSPVLRPPSPEREGNRIFLVFEKGMGFF